MACVHYTILFFGLSNNKQTLLNSFATQIVDMRPMNFVLMLIHRWHETLRMISTVSRISYKYCSNHRRDQFLAKTQSDSTTVLISAKLDYSEFSILYRTFTEKREFSPNTDLIKKKKIFRKIEIKFHQQFLNTGQLFSSGRYSACDLIRFANSIVIYLCVYQCITRKFCVCICAARVAFIFTYENNFTVLSHQFSVNTDDKNHTTFFA